MLPRGRIVRGGRYGVYGEFFPSGRATTGSLGNFILRGGPVWGIFPTTHGHPKAKTFARMGTAKEYNLADCGR